MSSDTNGKDEQKGCLDSSYVQVTTKPVAYTVASSDELNIDYDKDGEAVGFELLCNGKDKTELHEIDLPGLTAEGKRCSRGPFKSSFGAPPSGPPPE